MSSSTHSSSEGPLALVMDVGGNWIRAAIATQAGDLIWRDRIPTEASGSSQQVIDRIESMLHKGIAEVGEGRLVGIGLGLAGPIDPVSGIMYSPPNIPGLDGVSFKTLWREKVSLPVFVANDATLSALGEYSYGQGAGAHMLVYMTISTGIGGGIVANGRPLMGANGMAGELGHMSIDSKGPLCQCGNVGCLERIASGTAIADRARDMATAEGSSILTNLASGDLSQISSETVFEAAYKGDQVSQQVIQSAAQALGAGLVNILHIFNPDVIVIGGGVSGNWDYLKQTVEPYIETHAMDHIQKMGYKLFVSTLGDNLGLLGAAALVWQQLETDG